MGKKSRTKMPERWTEYSAMGEVIPGTQFIAFKVPLKPEYFDRLEGSFDSSIERFTTEDLLRKLKGKLFNVIDLSYKGVGLFYDPQDLESCGIKYEKLYTAGHVVPSNDIVKRFTSIVENALMNKPKDKLIGVHCTHGVNRTGYMITRYMVENLNFTAEDAQKAFEKGRGYAMERKNYIESLQQIEKSLKGEKLGHGTPNETQETDEYSIPSRGRTDHQYRPDSYFNDVEYQERYYDYYEGQRYSNECSHFSRTRPPLFNNDQRIDFSDMHWQKFPSASSFNPHTGYDDYADSNFYGRDSRYRPYERHRSNRSMYSSNHRSKYHWSKTDSTNSRPSTQYRERNFRRRNPKGSHIHFN